LALVKGSEFLIKLIIRFIFVIVISISLFDCAGNSYKKMSIENPEKLLSIQDSLMQARGNDNEILAALAIANNNLAEKFMDQGDYNLAINHFSKSLILNETSKESKYGLLLVEGRVLVKKGNKNGIWDAIEKYSKASSLYPNSGEPFYLTALAYTKLGDTDFDLILESYEKSISLELDERLRAEVVKKYEHAKKRKTKLDSFWK
tara:strand:+ start:358 stop:969 length:612 start_codon:yes stop_codon:yes gene_type:complete